MQRNTVCWLNCGTTGEVSLLVADVAAVATVKLPTRNPFPPGPLYRAFEMACGAAVLALDSDIEFRLEAERFLHN